MLQAVLIADLPALFVAFAIVECVFASVSFAGEVATLIVGSALLSEMGIVIASPVAIFITRIGDIAGICAENGIGELSVGGIKRVGGLAAYGGMSHLAVGLGDEIAFSIKNASGGPLEEHDGSNCGTYEEYDGNDAGDGRTIVIVCSHVINVCGHEWPCRF